MKKTLAILLAAALLLAALSGCAAQEEPAAPAQETASAEGYPVTVENYGRTVTVNKRPEKVLTLGPNCTELFAALGLSDLVVGRSLVNHSRGPLPEYEAAVNAIPELNHASATREAVLSIPRDRPPMMMVAGPVREVVARFWVGL